MNLILTVLEIIAPVFLLGLVGFVWQRLDFDYRVQFVTRMAMTLSVPCLIFTALMQTEIDPAGLLTLTLAALTSYVAVSIAVLALLRVLGLEFRTFWHPLVFGNTGNIGLPLALFAFGAAGLEYAVVVFAAMAILSFTIGVWAVSGGGSVLKAVQEPMVAATILGALFLWQGWETPRFLTNSLELIGQMAIPLMLITLGVAVARLTAGQLSLALWLSAAKFGLSLAAGMAAVWVFGLTSVPAAVLILQVTTPVAVTSYLMAEKYGADADAVAGLVVVSTVLSVGLLPLTLAFLI